MHQKGFRVRIITLVTTLLDAQLYSLQDLSELFFARWGIETNFAHLKTTMGLNVLKCQSVHGVLKELMVFALIYNLARLVMGQAARRQHVSIERLRFIDAWRWLASAHDNELLPTLVVNPHRPGRYEPRVRKRRSKPYGLMSDLTPFSSPRSISLLRHFFVVNALPGRYNAGLQHDRLMHIKLTQVC